MAKKRSAKRAGARPAADSRFGKIGQTTSQIVMDAAALLDEEVAAGIVAAKRVQERLQKQHRIDAADFGDALQRFQSDAHDIVNSLNDQFTRFRSRENDELIGRFVKNTHDLLDLAVGMVTTGAEIANQLAQTNLNPNKPPSDKRNARRR